MYLNSWEQDKFFEMVMDFEDLCIDKDEFESEDFDPDEKKQAQATLEKYKDIEILLASYADDGCYGGDAYVLFRKDNKLYEVNACHCSCFGIEGQWEPEETSIESIKHRLKEGSLGRDDDKNVFADELTQIIDKLEKSE